VKAKPLWIRSDGRADRLERADLHATGAGAYDEAWLQDLLYLYPDAIPVAEIDDAYSPLISLARELDTPAGPIDVLYITPTGRVAVLEAKLWRNPEARRKVVAQILDYAKELSHWDYATLDAQVRKVRRRSRSAGPEGILEIVRAAGHDAQEALFIDSVTRNLRRGDVLLLIAGDGIREGAGAITEFLEGHGTLHFQFGLIEVAVYDAPDGARLVQPRVMHQSRIDRRIVFSIRGDGALQAAEGTTPLADESEQNPAQVEQAQRFRAFWSELLGQGEWLDDKDQPLPTPTGYQNLFFRMPAPSSGNVTGFLAQSSSEAGVYLTFTKGPVADRLYRALLDDKPAIEDALGVPVEWYESAGKGWIVAKKRYPGLLLAEHRGDIQKFMRDRINRFITVFRPRIRRLVEDGVATRG
jgi:hypothetical protein